MADEERRRVKREAVSDQTRKGRHRAAVNPNARGTEKGRSSSQSIGGTVSHRLSRD